jgi:hypothetical protein
VQRGNHERLKDEPGMYQRLDDAKHNGECMTAYFEEDGQPTIAST